MSRRRRRSNRTPRARPRDRRSPRPLERVASPGRRQYQRFRATRKGKQAGTVAKASSDRRQSHRRVERMLKSRRASDPSCHDPSGIDQQHDRLVPLGAIGTDDRLARASRGRPVDAAKLVVRGVVAKLIKLGSASSTGAERRPTSSSLARSIRSSAAAFDGNDGRTRITPGSRRWRCRAARPMRPSTRSVMPASSKRPRRVGWSVTLAEARPRGGTTR